MVCKKLLLALLFPAALAAQPAITAVLNGASYTEAFSPGCWMVIFGTGLATTTVPAFTLPLPENLGGASVTVGGYPAHLLYASPTQVNALIPFEVPAAGSAKIPVVVSTSSGSASSTIYVNRNSPALFTRNAAGTGRALVFNALFRPVEILNEGDLVILYATGLGATNPPGKSDAGATAASPVTDEVEVFAGDQQAEVLYAGLAPGFPGVYQLNVRVPALWTDRLYLRQRNWLSNIATIGVPERANAEQIVASIEPVLPGTNSVVGWSLPLFAASATVQLSLRSGARPFVVAAVAGSGGSFIRIDPANGTQENYWTAPTDQAGHGDFGSLLPATTVMDFAQGCQPFPANKIPASRLNPGESNYITYSLPPPLLSFPGLAAGSNEWVQRLAPGNSVYLYGHFGDFIQIPCGSQKTGKTTFGVYVDGKLVASQDVVHAIAGR